MKFLTACPDSPSCCGSLLCLADPSRLRAGVTNGLSLCCTTAGVRSRVVYSCDDSCRSDDRSEPNNGANIDLPPPLQA
eukprot:scaffold275333_cov37-Prasinocladus_malaysianus.AAC.1